MHVHLLVLVPAPLPRGRHAGQVSVTPTSLGPPRGVLVLCGCGVGVSGCAVGFTGSRGPVSDHHSLAEVVFARSVRTALQYLAGRQFVTDSSKDL